jgi:uncharacterized protein (TIGR03435 family)
MLKPRSLILAACLAGPLYGQPAAGPRFEVASIRPSKADPQSGSGIWTGHGRIDAQNVTLKRCIMGAWGVGPHEISGGPDWLNSDRFEILAKSDRPTDEDPELMRMLQSLLADRFKLALHRETKVMHAFVLEVAKNGPKLEKAPPGESATNTSSGTTAKSIVVRCTGMDGFARVLAREMDLPVVNHTGLEGIFSFRLQWAPEDARTSDAASGPSIFTAIREQLGLRLRAEKAPVEILVIDRAEKPSPN